MPLDAAPPPPSRGDGQKHHEINHHSKKKRKLPTPSSQNGSSGHQSDHQLLHSVEESIALMGHGHGKEKKMRSSSPAATIALETPLSSSSRHFTGGSREKAWETEALLKSYQEKLQGLCFVCRVEETKSCGQVIFCDFPDCYRAYHSVSLILCILNFSSRPFSGFSSLPSHRSVSRVDWVVSNVRHHHRWRVSMDHGSVLHISVLFVVLWKGPNRRSRPSRLRS
jgi:hypothetical protein